MNVTELARKLKIPTKELLEILPEAGFGIGKKAIKINDSIAQKIIKGWPAILSAYKKQFIKEEVVVEDAVVEKKKITIPEYITVKEFSQKSGIQITKVLGELMKSGVLKSMNEKIDFDTASIVGADLGIEVEAEKKEDMKPATAGHEIISEGDLEHLVPRPPVIVIMGHVDHGKTKLLDTIRKTTIMDHESGGITQHIGAYQIVKKGKTITFIDTPGHEAFSTMRSRGAHIADIAILVIAADDGIKPQTKESIKIILAANIPMIVAINKIDKPEANIERVKQELAQENLLPEDWGGKTITQPISAKSGAGVDELLDTILLVAEMNKDKIVANPNRSAVGSVIESHVDKGEGFVATILIQNGTLKLGDLVFIQGMHYGKVKNLKDFLGKGVKQAEPSVPIKILGLKGIPTIGDILEVQKDVDRNQKIKSYQLKTQATSIYTRQIKKDKEKEIETFNIILRTDVLGSLEAIITSLDKIQHPKIQLNIIGKGVGPINESDVMLAESNNAIVFGFHSSPTPAAQHLIQEKNTEVKIYKIIYELLDEVKKRMEEKLKPEVNRIVVGRIKILKIFRKEKNSMIVGGRVMEGKAVFGAKIDATRKDTKIGQGTLTKLQSNKIDVNELETNKECGIQYDGKPVLEIGDMLELYKEETHEQKIN